MDPSLGSISPTPFRYPVKEKGKRCNSMKHALTRVCHLNRLKKMKTRHRFMLRRFAKMAAITTKDNPWPSVTNECK